MIFNSIEFIIFLPIVFLIYWSLHKSTSSQNVIILVASYLFYSWWDYRFLSLIIFSTVVDFVIGNKIEESKKPIDRKIYLAISLIANLGLLGFFKYYNFFIDSLTSAFSASGITIDTWSLNIILPVGISFYTFQTISYSIDIYKGKIKPQKNFISFAAFVSFFPQLVAGPIERASNLLPQFLKKREFTYEVAINGLSLIIYGLFKKIVVADRLAIYVNSVFSDIENATTLSLLIGIVFFSFQIYCDFSGYSLIARGTAKLFGFDLMVNFNKPYFASSITEFWRKWHISLSTWFRDYLYIPLGGNRVSTIRNYANLMIVFLVSGLWHGANWTFIFWGGLHGLFLVVYLTYVKIVKPNKVKSKVHKLLNVFLVYIVVCFAWIFFRAESVQEAFVYISKILEFDLSFNLTQICVEKGPLNLLLSFIVLGLLFFSYLLPEHLKFKKQSNSIVFNVVTILVIVLIGINGEANFIYFQF